MGIEKNSKAIVTNGLVLYLDAANPRSYPDSGSTWKDLSGNGYHFSLINSPVYNASNLGSLYFNGTNQYASIPKVSGLTFDQRKPYTISIWFIQHSVVAGRFEGLISLGDDTSGGGIVISNWVDNATNNAGNMYISGGRWTPSNLTINHMVSKASFLGKIQHMTLSYDGSVQNIWLNGSLIGGLADTNNINSIAANTFYIATRQITTRYTQSNVYNVMIHNRALSASEVLQNYEAMKRRYI